ncbi:MAG: hypothetical protein WC412_03110 [Candidatus Omnitrophota bacterium]|jgi:hypothetical protein
MKIFSLFLLFFLALQPRAAAYNFIEIDLIESKVLFNNYHFGNYNISADLLFDFKKENDSLILSLDGKDIAFDTLGEGEVSSVKRLVSWLTVKLVKKENLIFVNYLRSPQILARGKINLDNKEMLLDVDYNWQEKSLFLEGNIDGKVKIWGKIDDFLINGSLNIKNGKYQDVDFSQLTLHFLGKPPLFTLNNSEIYLADGSVYKIEGVMSLRDMGNIFPKAEFISKKVNIAGWEILSENQSSAGLKREVNDSFDILFSTYDREDQSMDTGAELRYKVKNNQFLRLRMQDDKTLIGFGKDF